MAERNRYSYISGNAARTLVNEPARRNPVRPEREERIEKPQKRHLDRKEIQAIRRRRKLNRLTALAVGIAIVVSMMFCIDYIKTYSSITSMEKQIASLQREISYMETANSEAKKEIDAAIDLKLVYEKAVNEFGMRPASKEQVFTYKNKKSDRVIQYADIPE